MFCKDNSSLYTKGKRAKDVPVRKSDRKQLLAVVQAHLNPEESADGDGSVQHILEACFLKGSLMKRSIKLPSATTDLFIRSPNQEKDKDDPWPYSLKPQCVWFQLDENRVVHNLPSLALLAAVAPNISCIPTMITPPEVSKFVCRGANLMRAGIFGVEHAGQKCDTTTIKDRVCLVAARGNPLPYAVGLLHPQLACGGGVGDVVGKIGPGKQGTGVAIVHAYGDDIWRQQLPSDTAHHEGVDNGNFGNTGFLDGEIVAAIDVESEDSTVENSSAEAAAAAVDPSTAAGEDSTSRVTDGPSPEEVLHSAVCKALSTLSVKKDLPMRMATFYARHVILNRPEGTVIELKQTKYKKFGAYVTEQVEYGLLSVGKDEQNDPFGMLVGYDRRHVDVQAFLESSSHGTENVQSKEAAGSSQKKLALTELYCVPSHFVSLLRLDPGEVKGKNAVSAVRRNKGTLTLKEIRDILDGYIEREELVKPERRDQVVLDGPLTDALFKAKKGEKATGTFPTSLSRKEVTNKWKSRLEPAYALVELPGNIIVDLRRGKPPSVTIEVSRRQSNKFITKVTGLEKFGIAHVELAKDIAQRFACATSTEPSGNSNGSLQVLIQGRLSTELKALLIGDASITTHGGAKNSPYSIPKSAVEVVLRKGVPKARR